MTPRDTAWAIAIGDRFFYRLHRGRVQTAWCLAGAKLWQYADPDLVTAMLNKLRGRGKAARVVCVAVN